MTRQGIKRTYFVIEGVNAFATAYYLNYLYFYMQRGFGWGDRQNLWLTALSGLVYTVASWQGGRYAQRRGYRPALRLGLVLMMACLAAGTAVRSVVGHLSVVVGWTVGMALTWAPLEALASDQESPSGLPRAIGIYNLVWAGAAAFGYFAGGALFENLGYRSIFVLPAFLHLVQLGLLRGVEGSLAARPQDSSLEPSAALAVSASTRRSRRAPLFLKLAWTANPFAYVAAFSVMAVVPGLAERHGLSPMWAGFFCSVWLFARWAAFLGLWQWAGWHYRFRWFVLAYLLMIGSFGMLLLAPALAWVVVAQVGFGSAIGLIYYSSLYYSMDAGEAKGEHGGIHEAAIGAGIFGGPAVGGTALHLWPEHPHAGVWAVTAVLVAGFAWLLRAAWRGGRAADL